ncbi:anti-sigma factor [Cellulomonas sp. URHD0024]|uniref:anti-sigma factor n=1 Tax=Cellulomonas sp. URHD0024 TaxID=1302620 RepID=UPI00041B39CA|nr:anti-sigma factor [Cellulomonas sp. URHD0024]
MDDDALALLALGEQVASPTELVHLEGCERCTDELAALRAVVDLARSAGADTALVAPAPEVWERVADELDLTPQARALAAQGPSTNPVVSIGTRRRPRSRATPWVAAAAAVGLVVGGAGVWWWTTRAEPVTVLATATLEPLPGWQATGSAVVETSPDGSRVLVVDLSKSMTSPDAFQEVWLLTPDVSGLVSVGNLDGATGRFDLPSGLDLTKYSVVDVSQEAIDGNPAHSGDSIVRGPLRA